MNQGLRPVHLVYSRPRDSLSPRARLQPVGRSCDDPHADHLTDDEVSPGRVRSWPGQAAAEAPGYAGRPGGRQLPGGGVNTPFQRPLFGRDRLLKQAGRWPGFFAAGCSIVAATSRLSYDR
jgi:hypothetical protein